MTTTDGPNSDKFKKPLRLFLGALLVLFVLVIIGLRVNADGFRNMRLGRQPDGFSSMTNAERTRRVQTIMKYEKWFDKGRTYEEVRKQLPWMDAALHSDVRQIFRKSPGGSRRQEALEQLFH